MADEKKKKKDTKEPKELSYGKQMTSLLIVKDMRSKPKEILKGLAFIAFVSFFVFSAVAKSCQQDTQPEPPVGPSSHLSAPHVRSA